jgi:hypothetical protein
MALVSDLVLSPLGQRSLFGLGGVQLILHFMYCGCGQCCSNSSSILI